MVDVTTAVTVTAWATALGAYVVTAQRLVKPLKAAKEAVDRRRARKPAANLDTLEFPPGGMRQPIARIAAGTGSPADLDILSAMLHATAEKVDRSIKELSDYDYRTNIRETFGMRSAQALDKIIFDKTLVRQHLREMTENQEYIDHLRDKAKEVSALIDKLNADLSVIHDMILPPRRASANKISKAASKRKRK